MLAIDIEIENNNTAVGESKNKQPENSQPDQNKGVIYQSGLLNGNPTYDYEYYCNHPVVAIAQVGAMPFGFGGHAEIIYEDQNVADASKATQNQQTPAYFGIIELGNDGSNVNASTMSSGIGGMATTSGSSSNVGSTRNSSSGKSRGSSISGSTFLGQRLFKIRNEIFTKQSNHISIANNMNVLQMEKQDFDNLIAQYSHIESIIDQQNEHLYNNQFEKVSYKLLPTMADAKERHHQYNCASFVADLLDSAGYKMQDWSQDDQTQTLITPYLVSTATWEKKENQINQ